MIFKKKKKKIDPQTRELNISLNVANEALRLELLENREFFISFSLHALIKLNARKRLVKKQSNLRAKFNAE